MLAIYKREIRAYLTSLPMYIFAAVYLLSCGLAFSFTVLQPAMTSSEYDLSSYFMALIIITAVVMPILTMRLFSEDKKLKTEQLILTSPVSVFEMVMGKFLAAYTVFFVSTLISALQLPVLASYATEFNGAVAFGSLIALWLLGAAFIAVGTFFSSITESQVIAALCSLIAQLAFVGASFANSAISNSFIRNILVFLSVYSRFSGFTSGRFDFTALVYYLSITFIFLFFTTRVYLRRRYA